MIISSSNIFPEGTLSTPSGGTVDNIKSNLGGSVWNPDGIAPVFGWTGNAVGVTYMAGVGSGFTRVTISIAGGETRQASITRNGCFFIAFDTPQDFTGLTVEFLGAGVLVNFAMGTSFTVPNGGEQSGYQRIPLQDNRVFTSSMNRAAIPVAQSVRRLPLRGKLNIANMAIDFAETTWFDFTKYALTSGYFYILEKETDAQFAYMCFEPDFDGPRAHSSTRALVRAGVSFKAYHGG